MGKRGRGYLKRKNEDDDKSGKGISRSRSKNDQQDMDDEIDVFHKHRDKISLDMKDDLEESDEDSEVPVLDMEEINDEEDDEDEDDEDVVKKIIKTNKYLKAKLGGVDDDMHEEDEEDDNPPMVWDRRHLHSADNRKFELLSSDDEAPEEEEKEARAIQMKRVENFTMEDLGLEDEVPESDKELTLEEMSTKRKSAVRSSDNDVTVEDLHTTSMDLMDLNAFSKEEQVEALHSTAPELFVLQSELNEALEFLDSKINPFLTKVKSGEIVVEGGIHYFEIKQLLLFLYCQAISFYFILKSEGQPVRDHPVIARLVELKNLLDQMKELDDRLPIKLEEILQRNHGIGTLVKLGNNGDRSEYNSSDKVTAMMKDPRVLNESEEAAAMKVYEEDEEHKPKKNDMKEVKKRLEENNEVGKQSLEMLKVREALEKKLKEKGVFKSISKSDKVETHTRLVNGKLETYDDFDDVAVCDGRTNNPSNDPSATKFSKLLTTKHSKAKVISGDDDLPKRDDIGERRRKFEVQVLSRAGLKSEDEIGDGIDIPGPDDDANMEEDDDDCESGEDELYKQAEQRLAAKRTAKSQAHSRKPPLPSLPETVDGKRHISYQMDKNRGLTRPRNKLTKNPRKKYKLKHQKAVKRLQGRAPNLKQQSGIYSGELHGINAAVSKSVRLKS